MTHMPRRIDLPENDSGGEETINEAMLKSKSQGQFDGFINDENALQKSRDILNSPTNKTYQSLIEEVKIPTWKIEDERDISKAEVCQHCGKPLTKQDLKLGRDYCPVCMAKGEKTFAGIEKSKMIKAPIKEPVINKPPVKNLRNNINKMIDIIEKGKLTGEPAKIAYGPGTTRQKLTRLGLGEHLKPPKQLAAETRQAKQAAREMEGAVGINKAKYEGEEKSKLQSAKASQDRPKTRTINKARFNLPQPASQGQKITALRQLKEGKLSQDRYDRIMDDIEASEKSGALKKSVDSLIEKIEKSRAPIMPKPVKYAPKAPDTKYKTRKTYREGGQTRGPRGAQMDISFVPSGEKLAKELIKCNPAKERAAMRVKKAIILFEKQLGNNWIPMSDRDVLNSLNLSSVDQIPEILRKSEDRPPVDWFTYALSRASLFTNDNVNYAGEVWFGKGWKTLAGTGLGGVVGGMVGGPVGAGLGAIAGKTIGETFDKPKKAPITKAEVCKHCGRSMTEKDLRLGRDYCADCMVEGEKRFGETEESEKIEKIGPLAAGLLGAGAGYLGSKLLDKARDGGRTLEDFTPEELGYAVLEALNKVVEDSDDEGLKKQWQKVAEQAFAHPKETGEGIREAGKGIKEAAEGIASIRPGQLNKAVAEPLDSKMQPRKREPVSDFGGESEISGSGSHSNVADLASESEKVVTN